MRSSDGRGHGRPEVEGPTTLHHGRHLLSLIGAMVALTSTVGLITWSVGIGAAVPKTTEMPVLTDVTATPASVVFGASVTYTGTVAGTDDTLGGEIIFYADGLQLCSADVVVPGTDSCTATNAPTGADTVTAQYGDDIASSPVVTDSTTLLVTSGPYIPMNPVRICDTRANNPSNLTGEAAQCNGPENSGDPFYASGSIGLFIGGQFGVPVNATAVVLNVAAVDPSAAGFLALSAPDVDIAKSSSVSFVPGQVIPNLVEVTMSYNAVFGGPGEIALYASAPTNVVVDLEGYVAPTPVGATGAGLYDALASPARICDTRAGNPSSLTGADAQCNGTANAGSTVKAGGTLNVKVAGDNGVPVGASAAVLNVSEANPTAAGFLTVYPQGAAQPTAANVNYTAGQVTGNRVIVPLSASGGISIFSSAAADVIVDLSGYFSGQAGTGAQYVGEPGPVRICDTRPGNPSNLSGDDDQCLDSTISPGQTLTVQVVGLGAIPTTATAVVLNLTAVAPTQDTYLTVYPSTRPLSSDMNPVAGQVLGNLTVATISKSGTISIYNYAGNADVVLDVMGYYD
jgi:hypothetical protein